MTLPDESSDILRQIADDVARIRLGQSLIIRDLNAIGAEITAQRNVIAAILVNQGVSIEKANADYFAELDRQTAAAKERIQSTLREIQNAPDLCEPPPTDSDYWDRPHPE